MKLFLTGFACLITLMIAGQTKTGTMTHHQDVPGGNPVLVVANISGDIIVETHESAHVTFEVEKNVTGKTSAAAEKGFRDIQVKYEVMGDTVVCYIDYPCGDNKKRVTSDRIWKYYFGDCAWDDSYEHTLNFRIGIPKGMDLRASTINNGRIVVRGVQGNLEVDNVNGDIALYSVGGGSLRVSSVNGEVEVNCSELPGQDSRLYALNGDINATFPDDLSAKVTFTTFNGELFTEFETQLDKPLLKKLDPNDIKGTKFKVGGYPAMTIGSGAILLEVETFNGDAYLRKSRAR